MKNVLISIVLFASSAHAMNKNAVKSVLAMTTLQDITRISEMKRSPGFVIKIVGNGFGIKCQTFNVHQDYSTGIYSAELIAQSNEVSECHD